MEITAVSAYTIASGIYHNVGKVHPESSFEYCSSAADERCRHTSPQTCSAQHVWKAGNSTGMLSLCSDTCFRLISAVYVSMGWSVDSDDSVRALVWKDFRSSGGREARMYIYTFLEHAFFLFTRIIASVVGATRAIDSVQV